MLTSESKREDDYISLPFPSAYAKGILPVVVRGEKAYSDNDSYSKKKTTDLLSNNGQVGVDIPRTSFRFGSFQSTEDIRYLAAMEKSNDLNISRDQLEALMVFSSCIQGEAVQGGLFSVRGMILFAWLNSHFFSSTMQGTNDYVNRVVKNKKSELCVLHTVFFYDPSLGSDKPDENSAPMVVRMSFKMTPKKDGFKCACDKQEILIKKDFWRGTLIPAAFKKLGNSQFSTEDIVSFVPLLCDKEFAAVFVEKLKTQRQDRINEVCKYVHLCFGLDVELTFWQKHRSKIIGTVFFGACIGAGLFTVGIGTIPLISGVLMGVVAGISIGEFADNHHRNVLIQDIFEQLKILGSPPLLDLVQSWKTDYTSCTTTPSSGATQTDLLRAMPPTTEEKRESQSSEESGKSDRTIGTRTPPPESKGSSLGLREQGHDSDPDSQNSNPDRARRGSSPSSTGNGR